MNPQNNPSGVSLIELLIAIILLSVVVFATSTIDLASKSQLKDIDRQTVLYNEVNYAMESIVKDISQSTGVLSSPAVCIENVLSSGVPSCTATTKETGKVVMFRQSDNTISNLEDNTWGAYVFDDSAASEKKIVRYEFDGSNWNSGSDITRPRISSATFTRDGNENANKMFIYISARDDLTRPEDPMDNTEVSLESNVTISAMSVR
ncbi:MAG: prepilin-type N-terminal cleavage/methylation domain-containing protein [Candidatus Gygaella obscura]|nr:prepilin-type N-terminal cleavage/methylation domain-containing protein [Candidatus Gygaella obscura]